MARPDIFYRQIRAAVERRGEKGKQLWKLASGYNPMVSPATALENLRNLANVVRKDFEDEAQALIRDLDELFRR